MYVTEFISGNVSCNIDLVSFLTEATIPGLLSVADMLCFCARSGRSAAEKNNQRHCQSLLK